MEDQIVLVGEKFNTFANNNNVLTINNLRKCIMTQPNIFLGKKFLIGQGLTSECYALLNSYLSINKQNQSYLKNSYSKNMYTHKQKKHNILIGSTKKIDNDTYHLPMIIDENSELMSDHQTGQHIQGMVIVEAFRQTFIAVTEEFFPLSMDSGKCGYYIINTMNTRFINFVFPLPVKIVYQIGSKNIVQNKRAKFSAKIQAIQNEQICAEMNVSFSVYPTAIILNKENDLATFAINNTISFETSHFSIYS